jgi:EAL domain-containing protein (putative c-di-GMP-specific phosphodiesterase class I)
VAVGVEDAHALAYLWTAGIDYAQGFFLHEPAAEIGYDDRD